MRGAGSKLLMDVINFSSKKDRRVLQKAVEYICGGSESGG